MAKKLFPNYIWDVSTSEKVIYLTFDDGPTPEITHWTLDVLKTYNAKATFFCIGNNIEKHPEIFQNILNAGHAIGNHTQNHIKGWKTKAKDYLKNIELCETILKSQITDSSIVNSNALITNLFRPPYGQITPKQGNELMALGYKIVMWDVLSFDWEESIEKENCLNNVITKTIAGSIIVFHDSIKASRNMQYALPQVLKHFSEKGYCFKALNTAV
ncbi:polysaccharide deacetylase family protein [Algibacter sp.]|uniref:polysaccharide deacetylase family protein n=1 Tax=Algibacter sp. TaxID=1872428 RepID=UPI00342A44E3